MSAFSCQTTHVHTASALRVEMIAVAPEQTQAKAYQDPSLQPLKATRSRAEAAKSVSTDRESRYAGGQT